MGWVAACRCVHLHQGVREGSADNCATPVNLEGLAPFQRSFLSSGLSSNLSNKIEFTSNTVHVCVCEDVRVLAAFMCGWAWATCECVVSDNLTHTPSNILKNSQQRKGLKLFTTSNMPRSVHVRLLSKFLSHHRGGKSIWHQKRLTMVREPCKPKWNCVFNPIYMATRSLCERRVEMKASSSF